MASSAYLQSAGSYEKKSMRAALHACSFFLGPVGSRCSTGSQQGGRRWKIGQNVANRAVPPLRRGPSQFLCILKDIDMATSSPSSTQRTGAAAGSASEYLTFRLGTEEYGIDILRVQEIRSYEQPTRMAHAPDFIKGVIDLRGVIVPIVDLRLKLHCATADYTDFTVVIILNVAGTVLGAVVDAVADVVALTADSIKPAPQFQSQVDSAFVRGIASVGERMLIVVDIESLLSSSEMGLVKAVATA
jgi:purine-binding chemotaxis protein CheW